VTTGATAGRPLVLGLGRGACGEAPVIHPAARGGPGCPAGLEGSIEVATVSGGHDNAERARVTACLRLVGDSCGILGGVAQARLKAAIFPSHRQSVDLAGDRHPGDLPTAPLGDQLEVGGPPPAAASRADSTNAKRGIREVCRISRGATLAVVLQEVGEPLPAAIERRPTRSRSRRPMTSRGCRRVACREPPEAVPRPRPRC
jgi:hypothetical protein